jgi:hypothetical protein
MTFQIQSNNKNYQIMRLTENANLDWSFVLLSHCKITTLLLRGLKSINNIVRNYYTAVH